MNEEKRERIVAAVRSYDGDAVRPESGVSPREVAEIVLREHRDLATCFCPACVLARAVLAP